MSLSHVLTPIRISDVEIRNRVARAAHGTLLGKGTMGDDLIAYHAARGRGGVGLSILEVLGVHWSSRGDINIDAPQTGDQYRKLMDTVRPTGMKMFQQLWHAGHLTLPPDGSPPWSSSDMGGFWQNIPALPMTKGMIDEIVESFARTARKMYDWGVDGVQVHAAHGYLTTQFLSPLLNHRTDDYGGSFGNRIRFLHEVMAAIREEVPASYPVGLRISVDENPAFVSAQDNIAAIAFLKERGLVDYVDVSLGNHQMMRRGIAGMHDPKGFMLPHTAPISRALREQGVVTIVTGRFHSLEDAEQVIAAGDADMVSFVRALIADPDMVNKTVAGHPEQVRPCIACNQGCIAQVMQMPHHLGCSVNPGAGQEQHIGDDHLAPASKPKRLLVVGGGPAGLEAARVAALRGHKVTLVEAENRLGGTLRIAALAPTRGEIQTIIDWLERELRRLGVDIRLGTRVKAQDVLAEPWEAVVVATGSRPRLDGLQYSNIREPVEGIGQPHVISSNDLLLGKRDNLGKRAVVIDETGHHEALAAAEYLIDRGMEVNFVTRHAEITPQMRWALTVDPALIRMEGRPFKVHLRSRAIAVERNSVTAGPIYLDTDTVEKVSLPADTVVFVSPNRSNRELHDALTGRVADLRSIGDAASPRFLTTAIREGHMAGATL